MTLEELKQKMVETAEELKKKYALKFGEWDCDDAEMRDSTMRSCVEAFLNLIK